MAGKIAIADDIDVNRDLIEDILSSEEYEIVKLPGGSETIDFLKKVRNVSCLLLDLVMPGVNGYDVLDFMKEKDLFARIPVIIISGETKVEVEKRCFEYDILDYIKKPFDATIVRRRVMNAVELYEYRNKLEERISKQTDAIKKQYKLLMLQADKLKKNNTKLIDVLGTIVENRRYDNDKHIERVKNVCLILGKALMAYPEYELTEEKVNIIANASALHDIGKISISDSVLLKAGKLTEEELDYVKSHTTKGCEILNKIKNAWDKDYAKISHDICRWHHERYDGKGYPDGLLGNDIPICAQIVSIADVYDSLISEKVYKEAYSIKDSYKMIVNGECGSFNPRIIKAFTENFEEIKTL